MATLIENSPSPRKRKARRKDMQDPSVDPRLSDIVDTHEKIQALLVPKDSRLETLRKKRLCLQAEIDKLKCPLQSVGTVLENQRQNQERSYLRKQTKKNDETIETSLAKQLDSRGIAARMQKIRHLRMIAAAFRISGISLLPCPDDEVLALRFDIAVDGKYVACYHTFFDLVVLGEESVAEPAMIYLRLVQHTLPSCIPLNTIMEQTVGKFGKIGPLKDSRKWESKDLVDRLRNCSTKIYQACFCYCVRKEAYAFLSKLIDLDDRDYSVDHVTANDSYDKIVFHLKLISGAPLLDIQMNYKDPFRQQPTLVLVRNKSETRQLTDIGAISDDEDSVVKHDDLCEEARMAFRHKTIESAVTTTVEHMRDW